MALSMLLLILGILANVVVFALSDRQVPRFTRRCSTCGYRMPPMAYPPAVHDCPECDRLVQNGVDLNGDLGVDLSGDLSDRFTLRF